MRVSAHLLLSPQAGVSMALDIAILAVPGLGTTVTSQILCSCFYFSVLAAFLRAQWCNILATE
jgi:hypothetical protein